jgi:hypothetical protein
MTPGGVVNSGVTRGRVATAGVLNQVIANAAVTAGGVIMVSYENAAGGIVGVAVGARNAGVNFQVNFAAIPPAGSFINYVIYP